MPTDTRAWPTERPVIETERLILQPLTSADEAAVVALAGDRRLADTTIAVPHPYTAEHARDWIGGHAENWAQRKSLALAVCARAGGELHGVVALSFALEHHRAELGYWIGVPYWNRGYATEAAHAIVAYAFTALGLQRVHARHLARNPASGRVMQKVGMTREGLLRHHTHKWGRPEDVVLYGILRDDLPPT